MCGIIGIWNYKGAVDPVEFVRMRDKLVHRGPDGAGLFQSDNKQVMLGHRRLSLIDLSETGKQPMCNEDKSIWITINGEIYNFRSLKSELQKKGHVFSSTSDSEVVIHGYEEWGEKVLDKMKGMFAFCIFDANKQIMFIARDRFGIKPCYYYHDQQVFLFASELKPIVAYSKFSREINPASICNYLTYRYIPSPDTIWKHTYKIPPAHYLKINHNQQTELIEYWKPEIQNRHQASDFMIKNTGEFIQNSIEAHLKSDVEVGSFLSGGYDSSAIVYYLSKLQYPVKTFSIGFDGWNQSEHHYAGMVSSEFNTDHYYQILNQSSLDVLDELAYYYDEPIADISIVPTYFVSRLAAKKVKAVLSGEGSDEIFAGYTWHGGGNQKKTLQKIYSQILNLSKTTERFSAESYAMAMSMGLFDKDHLKKIIGNDFKQYIPEDPFWFYKKHFMPHIGKVKSFQYLDIKTFMGELVLTKIDRASMANSLEVRVPFLDHELFEFILGVREKDYVRSNKQKFLLYENIKLHLPSEIIKRKKQGFVGPDNYYMNMKLYRNVLEKSFLADQGIVDMTYLNKLICEKDHWRLWKILILENWFRKWM